MPIPAGLNIKSVRPGLNDVDLMFLYTFLQAWNVLVHNQSSVEKILWGFSSGTGILVLEDASGEYIPFLWVDGWNQCLRTGSYSHHRWFLLLPGWIFCKVQRPRCLLLQFFHEQWKLCQNLQKRFVGHKQLTFQRVNHPGVMSKLSQHRQDCTFFDSLRILH